MRLQLFRLGAWVLALSALVASVSAAERAAPNPLKNADFGETHLHTAYSLDAYIGGTRLLPSDAYRFCKGEEVTVLGRSYRISKPLDFAAVTDHAEYIGEMYSALIEGAPGHDQDLLKQLRGLTDLKETQQWFQKYVMENNRGETPQHPSFFAGEDTVRGAWRVAIEAAEEHNEPDRFTTFVAFEWSGAPGGPICTAISSFAMPGYRICRSVTSTSTGRTVFGTGWPVWKHGA